MFLALAMTVSLFGCGEGNVEPTDEMREEPKDEFVQDETPEDTSLEAEQNKTKGGCNTHLPFV